ncbi:MAG: uroporphyrin-III C-methyltransferase / precorrin-2 dehydrogenase / sirohydrochlorin ferrochelatase [Sphingomonadales bacterium]|jgi:uroporphyrin-III C-methyltransferase/precorrin-2 dehydrogenase/sirohydrochlorin ferrochelatase|nr:uroporphyrin-III C-methyltransferase / precorrin-2 dehydrogenase / sirohydrochlorin ferrochelatase [Sphingomonadales bacterium]
MSRATTLQAPQRRPEAVPARIAPLATLPLFHRLAGRKAIVAGSSDGALWKAELLAAAGAQVLVLVGEEGDVERFEALPSLTVERRCWTAADLDGAALAVADPGGAQEAERFAAAARSAGVPVNLIDRTELCDVQFGTIVNRSPILLAISTGGAAPMLGQSIRARIEAVLPLRLSAWAKAAQALRPRLKEKVKSFADRRAFWEGFVERAWAGGEPDGADTRFEPRSRREGRVTLVGAGPGDPELLTLKAVRALQSATIILYDDLVGPEILELARREAKRVAVGKTGRGPSCRQSDINAEMVALALAGENVVRLKGGDPLVFGRATEEIDACRAAGIEVMIVPGISAAQGAAASLGFSLTERREARRIQFVTGHGADGRLPGDLDWGAIADPAATTIVYMPRATLAEFARSAIAAGLSPDTPALAIASATLPAQAQVSGTIATVAGLAGMLPPAAPVTVVIGRVARERSPIELRAAA